jgi:C1A family cysteine protease
MLRMKFFVNVTMLVFSTFTIAKSEQGFEMYAPTKYIFHEIKKLGDWGQESQIEQIEVLEKKEVPLKSRGQMALEAAKAKNKALIQEKREQEKKFESDSQNLSELQKLKRQDLATRKAWMQDTQQLWQMWKKQQDQFLGRIKDYQTQTFDFPLQKKEVIEKKIIEKKILKDRLPQSFLVKSALEIPVKDQKNRATCAAFAGVRALEILAWQQDKKWDLSEQYFYWSSKEDCLTTPCRTKGSWVVPGFEFSRKQTQLNIPLEEGCPYVVETIQENETQIPLQERCLKGVLKVKSYQKILTLMDVLEELKKNRPVVLGATLTPNFYKNQGLILAKDRALDLGLKMDGHAHGHAFLAVGFHEMPKNLVATEGEYCVLLANSWGEGWGAGGYACASLKWLELQRVNMAFVSLSSEGLNF